ncbi:DegT/DnrJ/EryC1/StrS family aminotransferase [Bacillus sp. SL00103]
MGRFGVYSFNGNKIITTSGGGMLGKVMMKSRSNVAAFSLRRLESAMHYEHQEIGYNHRMNLLAGVGIAQMEILDER